MSEWYQPTFLSVGFGELHEVVNEESLTLSEGKIDVVEGGVLHMSL